MATEHPYLLDIADDARREALRVLLDFMGEEVEEGDAASADAARCAGILLNTDDPDMVQRIEALAATDTVLPCVLVGTTELLDELSDQARQLVVEQLAWPLRYQFLIDALHRAEVYRRQHDASGARGQVREVMLFRSLAGASRPVQTLREMMAQVADKEVTVLITGESGTGKEVVARNIHYHSPRKEGPFVPVNCGAIPGELLESELFGHEKGAFTGAISSRPGRFELAAGGTLFLDEIGDMPLAMQVKILRVLQERTFERVGSNKSIEADVRVIAATHRNLEEMIESGGFREDLYYRLNVFPVETPPLRERTDDIPLLINELVSRLEKEQRGSIRFNSSAILSLCRHAWPGNVRELANLVERLAIMHPYGTVGLRDLPHKYRHIEDDEAEALSEEEMDALVPTSGGEDSAVLLPLNGLNLKEHMESIEKTLIEQALDDSEGVVARAAEKLHLRRTTLVEKMRKFDLSR